MGCWNDSGCQCWRADVPSLAFAQATRAARITALESIMTTFNWFVCAIECNNSPSERCRNEIQRN